MPSHDLLDGCRSFIGIVEWDRSDVVIKHMGLCDAMVWMMADEAEIKINSCSCSADICPGTRVVVSEGRISML